jgi:hypothetical protein
VGYSFKEAVDLCKGSVPPRGKLYIDNPNLGLVASLVKWHRICNELDSLVGTSLSCGLCYSHIPHCQECGLGSRHTRCTDRGKPFARITQFFQDNRTMDFDITLSSLDESDQVMYREMYDSVRNLCTQDQLEYFDSVFQ